MLIAGKGHEDYQIVGTQKFHFDDREVAREAIGKRLRCMSTIPLRAPTKRSMKAEMSIFTIDEVLEVDERAAPEPETVGGLRRKIRRLCSDSREVGPGDLFIAFKGEHFDGHRFVEQALRKGAIGALIEIGSEAASSIAASHASTEPPFILVCLTPSLRISNWRHIIEAA